MCASAEDGVAGARSPAPAWTGPNAGPISPAPWAPAWPSAFSSSNGSSVFLTPGRYGLAPPGRTGLLDELAIYLPPSPQRTRHGAQPARIGAA